MSRLGRNPFEKKAGPATPPPPAPEPAPAPPSPQNDPTLLEWAAVELPAQLLIGGLKAGLLAHSLWSAWSESRKRHRIDA